MVPFSVNRFDAIYAQLLQVQKNRSQYRISFNKEASGDNMCYMVVSSASGGGGAIAEQPLQAPPH